MASVRERAKLARAAQRLNERCAPHLPALLLMTDDIRVPDPVGAASSLPEGAGIILRHRDGAARERLGAALTEMAKALSLVLLVAGDEKLAVALGAEGMHFSEQQMQAATACRMRHPHWLITMAAHSERAVLSAKRAGADAALLAPLFVTQSHPGKSGIGLARFRFMAARAPLPVYALGGVTGHNVEGLAGAHIAGVAAIDGLVADLNSKA